MGQSALPSRPRFFRFSLRTLFVITVFVAAPLAWKCGRVRTQRSAAQAVAQAGGAALYDYECRGGKPTTVFYARGSDFSEWPPGYESLKGRPMEVMECAEGMLVISIPEPSPPGPAWLRSLVGDDFFASIERVNLGQSMLGPGRLANDTERACLEVALSHLSRVPSVKWITIEGASDETLGQLARMPWLKDVDVRGSFTDAGVGELARLELESLRLASPRLTPRSLIHLEQQKTLRLLMLEETEFLAEDKQRLQKALPDCEIAVRPKG